MKRLFLFALLAGVSAALSLPALAAAPARSDSVVIRHELRGCHTWSLNGGKYRAKLRARAWRGGALTIINMDPMVHKLVQLAGPRTGMRVSAHDHMRMVGLHRVTGRGVMNHMGAALKVFFPSAGVYRFTTEDLGDDFELKTVGHHKHLMLTVRVQ